jgi:hypothetical protein
LQSLAYNNYWCSMPSVFLVIISFRVDVFNDLCTGWWVGFFCLFLVLCALVFHVCACLSWCLYCAALWKNSMGCMLRVVQIQNI